MPTEEWNELVPTENRFASPNYNSRKPADALPTHIVIHVTGTNDLASVTGTFLKKESVSAHYLVGRDGALFQFVPDTLRAWHAGVDSSTGKLYRKGKDVWQRYLRYFGWYHRYPGDALYVDGDLKPVWDTTEAMFVARADGSSWPEYDYFGMRWPGAQVPVNFDVEPDPNNYAIGIETLGFGAETPDPNVYPERMYARLRELVSNLSQKYQIPMEAGRVVGHEDVNPIGRFGWDPGAGFDWSRVHS